MQLPEIITGDDFYRHQYGIMFESMVELFNEGPSGGFGYPPEPSGRKGCASRGKQPGFCQDIITIVPTSANVKSYANIVREKAVLRKLIKVKRRHSKYLLHRKRKPGGYSGSHGEVRF